MRIDQRTARIWLAAATLLWVGVATPLVLQAQQTADELAKEAANPIANVISVPFQNNTDFGLGSYGRTRNILNIQPVIPLAGGKLITRTVVPFAWLPDMTTESGSSSSGLSDIVFTAFYVPGGGETMWGDGRALGVAHGKAKGPWPESRKLSNT